MNGNRTVAVAGAFVRAFALGLVLCAGSGCVAFNVGEPEIHRERGEPRIEKSVLSFHESPGIFVSQTNELVYIGIAVNVESAVEFRTVEPDRTIARQRKMAFGLMPGFAENGKPTPPSGPYGARTRGDGSKLRSTFGMSYKGGGEYEGTSRTEMNILGMVFSIPYALLWEPFFGSWECGSHHWVGANQELLLKFSAEERERIGAWTYHEQSTHSNHMTAGGFSHSALFGFHRYCDYTVNIPVRSTKTTPADTIRTSTEKHTVSGPYTIVLSLLDSGYVQSVDVAPGATSASFSLVDAADGRPFANGTVRFLPPAGGLAAMRDEDDRAMLELAMENEWPVTVPLPAPRLGDTH